MTVAQIDELDAVVQALGGKPGEAHTVSAGEAMFAAVPDAREEWRADAIRMHEEALEVQPDHPPLPYNLACTEARGGRHLAALFHLKRAVALEPSSTEYAAEDADFAAIRNEPAVP